MPPALLQLNSTQVSHRLVEEYNEMLTSAVPLLEDPWVVRDWSPCRVAKYLPVAVSVRH